MTRFEKVGYFIGCAAGKNCDFLVNFRCLTLKFKGLLGERRRRERKFWNILPEGSIFSYLEEKAAKIVDLFAQLGGGCWSTLSTPPRYGPETNEAIFQKNICNHIE